MNIQELNAAEMMEVNGGGLLGGSGLLNGLLNITSNPSTSLLTLNLDTTSLNGLLSGLGILGAGGSNGGGLLGGLLNIGGGSTGGGLLGGLL